MQMPLTNQVDLKSTLVRGRIFWGLIASLRENKINRLVHLLPQSFLAGREQQELGLRQLQQHASNFAGEGLQERKRVYKETFGDCVFKPTLKESLTGLRL